jgi:hypothetical protein
VTGDRMPGLDCASTAVVAVLWLSFGPVSASSAQLVPAGISEVRGCTVEPSLAGVMAPEGDLLEDADPPVDFNPLAACAYEKGTGGAGISDFGCTEVIVGDRGACFCEMVI